MAVNKKKKSNNDEKLEDIVLDEEVVENIITEEDNLDNEDKHKSKRIYKIILVILLCICILGLVFFLMYPKIVLNGDNEIFISYNDDYVESGYKAKILNSDVSKYIKVDNNMF